MGDWHHLPLPALLARIVTTLDILSGGRAMLGIGAAWHDREHRALGVLYPSTSERFERLEEVLPVVMQMWDDNDGPYTGKHYQLAETMCRPEPITRLHPPNRIGGMGEQKTLGSSRNTPMPATCSGSVTT